jgi:hypothetical protein
MIEVVDLKYCRYESVDRFDLQMLLKQLVGQPFLFFKVSYGDELKLHLGRALPYNRPAMKGRLRGSYSIGARASSWFVNSAPRAVLLTSDDLMVNDPQEPPKNIDIREIESDNYISPGAIVYSAMVHEIGVGFALALNFSDGSNALIMPFSSRDAPEENGIEVADWEVFTPHDRYLRVGPGRRWSYLESSPKSGD